MTNLKLLDSLLQGKAQEKTGQRKTDENQKEQNMQLHSQFLPLPELRRRGLNVADVLSTAIETTDPMFLSRSKNTQNEAGNPEGRNRPMGDGRLNNKKIKKKN